jgi:hypothetical protein
MMKAPGWLTSINSNQKNQEGFERINVTSVDGKSNLSLNA